MSRTGRRSHTLKRTFGGKVERGPKAGTLRIGGSAERANVEVIWTGEGADIDDTAQERWTQVIAFLHHLQRRHLASCPVTLPCAQRSGRPPTVVLFAALGELGVTAKMSRVLAHSACRDD